MNCRTFHRTLEDYLEGGLDFSGRFGMERHARQCLSCGSRFTTYERLQPASLFVIKKDERREEFNKDKLLAGMRKACEKRPLPAGAVEKVADDIESELYALGKPEVQSSAIGDMVMTHLRKLDSVAYIRFASVYRDFEDITMLKEEVDSLAGHAINPPADQLPLLPMDDLPVQPIKATRRARR